MCLPIRRPPTMSCSPAPRPISGRVDRCVDARSSREPSRRSAGTSVGAATVVTPSARPSSRRPARLWTRRSWTRTAVVWSSTSGFVAYGLRAYVGKRLPLKSSRRTRAGTAPSVRDGGRGRAETSQDEGGITSAGRGVLREGTVASVTPFGLFVDAGESNGHVTAWRSPGNGGSGRPPCTSLATVFVSRSNPWTPSAGAFRSFDQASGGGPVGARRSGAWRRRKSSTRVTSYVSVWWRSNQRGDGSRFRRVKQRGTWCTNRGRAMMRTYNRNQMTLGPLHL